ncbi:Conserved oligomeric Golgi complex subunit 1 [Paramyrothecium foliicola]|nr:Conserved oligomeric Golgi complex subunit 1 [Paramyrothecium foliicola]
MYPEVFSGSHTLPQIRAIHKSLHVQIEEKASRLRTQVGSSYRDLLGTADTIVRMRSDNDEVQELLGRMGGRCGRAVVGVKAAGLEKFVHSASDARATEAARLRLLDGCGLVFDRILKGGGGLESTINRGDRLILATKVYVLSRLLVNSLGDKNSNEGARQAPESAKKTISTLRRRLLRGVDKVLEKADEETERSEVLRALCAYSLATNSGAKDVLRHFLLVRGKAMAFAFDIEDSERERTTEDVILGLKLYTKTILDVQALVPQKLSQSLNDLKRRPLLADTTIKGLEGLRLDIYGRRCSDDIQHFTPFIRHDDLDGKLAREMLMSWAEKGGAVLLDGLRKTLQHMADFKSIMELRTSVLRLWIRDGGRAKGFDPEEMQDDLREAINSRMLAVLDAKVSKLRLVGSEISATLEGWHAGTTDKHVGLWNEDGYDTALANGAAPFVQEVVARLYGHNDAVSKALNCYTSWYHVIDDVKDVVESLKKQRWDNDYEEIEDEDTIEARQQLLSKDDPSMLQRKLDTALAKSFEELDEQIRTLWRAQSDTSNGSAIAMYLLRSLRDIRGQLPALATVKNFGLQIVPELHEKVALHVSSDALEQFAAKVLSEKIVAGRPLWEGETPLPGQPSPVVFQFLRSLSLSMADAGLDLWSPAAIATLKKYISERLAVAWQEAMSSIKVASETHESKEEGGDDVPVKAEKEEENDEDDDDVVAEASEDTDAEKQPLEQQANDGSITAEQSQDLHVQWLFDVSMLQCSLGSTKSAASSQLDSLADTLQGQSGLESNSRQRIVKSSSDFWQRTSLLSPDQLLDAHQALAVEVLAQALVHLPQHQLSELCIFALAHVEDLVHEARLLQVRGRDTLAHDQGLVGLGGAQARDEGTRRTALGDQAERREGRQQERVRDAVDEVGERDEGGGKANDGPVEADDEDLGVSGKGVSVVEVVGQEALQPVLVDVGVGRGRAPADGDVGSSVQRIHVPALGQYHSDEDLIMGGNLTQLLRQVIVLHLPQRIELALVVNGENGNAAAVLEADDGLASRGRHCEMCFEGRGL